MALLVVLGAAITTYGRLVRVETGLAGLSDQVGTMARSIERMTL